MLLSLFPRLCFKVAPCSSCSESHKSFFSYYWDFFIELGLYIPTMGFLKCPRSS